MLSWITQCEVPCHGAFLRSDSIPVEIISTQNQHSSHFINCIIIIFFFAVREFSVLAWILQGKKKIPEVHFTCGISEQRDVELPVMF